MSKTIAIIAVLGVVAYFAVNKSTRYASFEAEYVEINRNGYVPPKETTWMVKASGQQYLIHKMDKDLGNFGRILMFDGTNFYDETQFSGGTSNSSAVRVHQYRFWNQTKTKKAELGEGEMIAGRLTKQYEVNTGSRVEYLWLDAENGVLLQRALFRDSSNTDLSAALEVLTCQTISYGSVDQSYFTEQTIQDLAQASSNI